MSEEHDHQKQPGRRPDQTFDTKKEDNHKALVPVPRWMLTLVSYVLMLMTFGAFATFVIVIFWIIVLFMSTHRIVENQELAKKALEKGQKTIIRRVDDLKKTVSPQKQDNDPQLEKCQ